MLNKKELASIADRLTDKDLSGLLNILAHRLNVLVRSPNCNDTLCEMDVDGVCPNDIYGVTIFLKDDK